MISLRTVIAALALLTALAVPGVSHGQVWDGYRLKEGADAHDKQERGSANAAEYFLVGQFLGYIVGFNDALSGIAICPPDGVKVGQLVGMVKKYVRDNPDKWNRPARELVIDALQPAFPCRK
jgi:hypothetical protein